MNLHATFDAKCSVGVNRNGLVLLEISGSIYSGAHIARRALNMSTAATNWVR